MYFTIFLLFLSSTAVYANRKSIYDDSHRHYSRYDSRYYTTFNEGRPPSMMINNPYGSQRAPLIPQNRSRYDDRYWEALYNDGIGPEDTVSSDANSLEAYLNGLEEKYKVEVTQFISMKPTAAQIMDYFETLSLVDSLMAKNQFLLITKSRSDFELVLSNIFSETEKTYNASMETLLKKLAPKLIELRYETLEYNRLRTKLSLITISDLDSPVRGMPDILRRQARAEMCWRLFQ